MSPPTSPRSRIRSAIPPHSRRTPPMHERFVAQCLADPGPQFQPRLIGRPIHSSWSGRYAPLPSGRCLRVHSAPRLTPLLWLLAIPLAKSRRTGRPNATSGSPASCLRVPPPTRPPCPPNLAGPAQSPSSQACVASRNSYAVGCDEASLAASAKPILPVVIIFIVLDLVSSVGFGVQSQSKRFYNLENCIKARTTLAGKSFVKTFPRQSRIASNPCHSFRARDISKRFGNECSVSVRFFEAGFQVRRHLRRCPEMFGDVIASCNGFLFHIHCF